MCESDRFEAFVEENIASIGGDVDFKKSTMEWLCRAIRHNYAQNFSWMGRPVIQVPQDIYAVQELVWRVRPDLIIETGIARGGSLILSASLLALLDYSDAVQGGVALDPKKSKRKVVGVDIDIRDHNKKAILSHPMAHMIKMIQGSSIDQDVVNQVRAEAKNHERVMVFLDSNHTHDHVLSELHAYAPLVTKGSYCVVWDTGVEDLPDGFVTDRPWGKGNNPKTAVHAYLERLRDGSILAGDGSSLRYTIDKTIENKISITAAPDGFLIRE